jgi:hypothetical protein
MSGDQQSQGRLARIIHELRFERVEKRSAHCAPGLHEPFFATIVLLFSVPGVAVQVVHLEGYTILLRKKSLQNFFLPLISSAKRGGELCMRITRASACVRLASWTVFADESPDGSRQNQTTLQVITIHRRVGNQFSALPDIIESNDRRV